MALGPLVSAENERAAGDDGFTDAPGLRLFVMGLFFVFGGITSLNDVIIPKLKELFTLNYTQAMLVQFCCFTAYAVICSCWRCSYSPAASSSSRLSPTR